MRRDRDRPELHRLLDQLREGDTVIVWKLDRLSRSLKDMLHIMECIADAGFRSITGAFAECAMIHERTSAGLPPPGPRDASAAAGKSLMPPNVVKSPKASSLAANQGRKWRGFTVVASQPSLLSHAQSLDGPVARTACSPQILLTRQTLEEMR